MSIITSNFGFDFDLSGNEPLENVVRPVSDPSYFLEYQVFQFTDQTSNYRSDYQSNFIETLLREINRITKHQLDIETENFLRNNNEFVPIIKEALVMCRQFFYNLTWLFSNIQSNGLDFINQPQERIIDNISFDIDIWDDPEFDNDDLIPVLIITVPEIENLDIFQLWKTIDEKLYRRIDSNHLMTSIRER